MAVTVDHAGNLVIADYPFDIEVYAVRTGRFYGRPMIADHNYLVAGVFGLQGLSGDGGPATKAKLNSPAAVAVDAAGNRALRGRAVRHGPGGARRPEQPGAGRVRLMVSPAAGRSPSISWSAPSANGECASPRTAADKSPEDTRSSTVRS